MRDPQKESNQTTLLPQITLESPKSLKKKTPIPKHKKQKPAYTSLLTFLAQQQASKYNLFLVDANNLMYSLRQETAKQNLRTHPFTRLYSFLQQHSPYKVIICASQHLAKYQTIFEKDPHITWLSHNMKKNDKDADIDTLLTGEGIEHILLNAPKIRKLFLVTGDKDLVIIIEKAMKRKIDCAVVGIKPDYMAQEFHSITGESYYLY